MPADCRLIFTANFETDESVLTGESLPVVKNPAPLPAGTGLAERANMTFSGTLAVAGFGDAVVTATGSATEFGRLTSLVSGVERERTPLQRAIARFSVRVATALGIFIATLFSIGIALGFDLFEMFLISVAVAVSAVPEGLPVALTVVLAIGVERLAKRKGIIRKLLAAETLGSTTIILTDKTGTLTQAKMELSAVLPNGTAGENAETDILREALRNIDVIIENPEDPYIEWRLIGPAIEVALVRGAAARGVYFPDTAIEAEILERLPFSSGDKFSAAIYRIGSRYRLVLLGAPEILIGHTDLSASERERALEVLEARARAGERVLGVAAGDLDGAHQKIPKDRHFGRLSFLGLLVLRDPLRPGVSLAIRRIGEAGVKTVIVTGDHAGTAEAVARELGMIDGKGAVLTGQDLVSLRPEELAARAGEVTVFARVTPEQKLDLVKLYRARGEVVAVTGDGVNDAPALEAADVGIAMGSGTEVAKSASDLVILDDNFETITAAIEEGRNILSNVRKVIAYLLSNVFDALFLIGGALVAGVPLPLNALQILFVNFFTDSFPAIALAFEREVDGPARRPRKLDPNLFDPEMRFLILAIGISTSFLLFVLYMALLRAGFASELVRSFIFASFSTYTLFLAFSVRSLSRSILEFSPFSNPYLLVGAGIGLALTAAAIYAPPLQGIFGTVALPLPWLLGVIGFGIANIAVIEFGKLFFRKEPSA